MAVSTQLAKRALGAIRSTKDRARRDAAEKAGAINSVLTVGGGVLAAFHDHKRGTPDEPAEIFGMPANLLGGAAVALGCMYLKQIPARGALGSIALGAATAGAYRLALEKFETDSAAAPAKP